MGSETALLNEEVIEGMVDRGAWIVGTPDDCVSGIERLEEQSGGWRFPGANHRLGATRQDIA